MGKIVNPYIAGAPVTEARMFFGREDVFQWIENSISGQYADHILVVHGQRRVGKTSVLKQLGNRLPKRYIPIFFDLQGRTHTTLNRFLWWLAREIVRVLKQERNIEIPIPEKEDFARDPEYFENQFLPDLGPALHGGTLLLTFDEFDNLEESEVRDELARPLIDYLRRLMETKGLNFVFSIGSSGRKLENMQAAYTEFFKTALYKKISFLNEEQTHNLVTRPVEDILEYDRQAVNRIYKIAGGHPYFTQLTCHELFARCQRTEQRCIKEQDVESVLEDVVERGTVNLKFVWDEASDIEKWGLAALAQLDKTDNRALADFLRKQRVRFSESDLTSGLLHLREKDVLTPENRFVIHLLRLWLQKNRPMEQVREELTEVNPIANRYLEIGLEFKDSHLYDKAIESFQEALAVARDNIQAQVNIALTYMDQKAYSNAVVEFEKALTMDDEDVSARAGLCEAHLALGNAAMQKGRTKDAIQSYQRVLAINAEHTEARGRMAEISRQRAEKALIDGKDEETLSAFAEALKYTPEDPTLIARVQQVREEKKARILATLTVRSEKEAEAKNWEGAIKSLEEALTFSPDDASIQKKISEVKVAQEKARREALLAKADTAAKSGRWNEAVDSLTAELSIKPDAAVKAKLMEIHVKQREARLGDLKAQAQGLARADRFGEALAAWSEYLSLNPDDHAEVEEKIQHARKYAAISNDYAAAQTAIREKRYGRAIELLQSIIAQDPTYKATTRLLVEAVESNKAIPVWRRPWVLPAVGAVVVLMLGVFFGPRLWESISTALARTPVATDGPSQSTAASSSTQAFAGPILTYIANTPPNFEEDFSTPKDYWSNTKVGGVATIADRVSNGAFQFSDKDEGFVIDELQGQDFVLEFDYVLNSEGEISHLIIDYRLGESGSDVIKFNPNSLGLQAGNENNIVNEAVVIPADRTYHFQILAQKNQFAIYVNNELITYSQEATSVYGEGIAFSVHTEAGFDANLDNIKFWNLEGVDFSTPAMTSDSGKTLTEAILAHIANTSPDFEDDFSSVNPDWRALAENITIADVSKDGILNLSLDAETKPVEIILQTPKINASQFVLEFDFYYEHENVTDQTGLGVVFRDKNPNTELIEEFRITPKIQFWCFCHEAGGVITGKIKEELPGHWNHLQIIVVNDEVFGFLNDQLLRHAEGINQDGNENFIFINNPNAGQAKIQIDNVKFWNLDGIDFSTLAPTAPPTLAAANPPPTAAAAMPNATLPPAWVTEFAQPILDAIASRPPDFQDDFYDKSGGWHLECCCGAWRMKYVDGELVLTVGITPGTTEGDNWCGVYRHNIDYTNFVAELDGRFLPGGVEDSRWQIAFRSSGRAANHRFGLNTGGGVDIEMFNGPGQGFPLVDRPRNQANHLLLIAKGSKFAFYANGQPLYHAESTYCPYGDLFLRVYNPNLSLGDTVVAFDNFKIWDISDLTIP